MSATHGQVVYTAELEERARLGKAQWTPGECILHVGHKDYPPRGPPLASLSPT